MKTMCVFSDPSLCQIWMKNVT